MKISQYVASISKLLAVLSLLFVTACSSSLVLKNVNYAQPVESVLQPDASGVVKDMRYAVSFSVKPLIQSEFGKKDTTVQQNQEIHIIRGHDGFYYVTAPGFKNVYIMAPGDGTLKTKKKVLVDENGLNNPAFNQRDPNIQLVDGSNTYTLSQKGLQK